MAFLKFMRYICFQVDSVDKGDKSKNSSVCKKISL